MPLVKYDPAGRNCLPPLFFPSLSERTHAPLYLYCRPYRQYSLTLACASACMPPPGIQTRRFCFKASISCYVFTCWCCLLLSPCALIPPATSRWQSFYLWIWCLWTRRCHRHGAIVATQKFNCHTWIRLWRKWFWCGSFQYVCFHNPLLSCTHQEPVIEKQMPFFCHVMGAELACLCVFVYVCKLCMQGAVGLKGRGKLITSAFHCIWLVCNGRQSHPGPDIRLMYGGEQDCWVCPFPF